MTFRPLYCAAFLCLAACSSIKPEPDAQVAAAPAEAAPVARACPEKAKLPDNTRCYGGRDSAGAFYLIAVPPQWNHVLVVAAHGGPELGPPSAERADADLTRWSVEVRAGYAWAGTTYHQGGVAVHSAAEDVERLRRIFVAHIARPHWTILHGQSWGGGVAAVAAQLYAAPGNRHPSYDGVLLSDGVLAGGTHSYDFRLDLRVVYEALCHNHPRPDEEQYPLWMGLPADSHLTHADLAERAKSCLGLGLPKDARTPEQQQKLDTVLAVIRMPERTLLNHLAWGTFDFRDIAQKRTGGRNVFGNIDAWYTGSPDDVKLNSSVARYPTDPDAVAAFARDTDPDGQIGVPVLTVHAIDDPIAMVEYENYFHQTMEKAGQADHLVQTFTDDHEHSYLADPDYPTLLHALLGWIETGAKPNPWSIARDCPAEEAEFGPGCRFRPDFRPAALDTRVTPRARP